jgi:hypothetical protein
MTFACKHCGYAPVHSPRCVCGKVWLDPTRKWRRLMKMRPDLLAALVGK